MTMFHTRRDTLTDILFENFAVLFDKKDFKVHCISRVSLEQLIKRHAEAIYDYANAIALKKYKVPLESVAAGVALSPWWFKYNRFLYVKSIQVRQVKESLKTEVKNNGKEQEEEENDKEDNSNGFVNELEIGIGVDDLYSVVIKNREYETVLFGHCQR